MSHEVDCPSCGGTIEVATRAARVAACPFCESSVIVNEAAVRALGKMSLLAETPSCLAVGWRATCLGKEIEVVGRIQYRYSAGLWDEWWVHFVEQDVHAWISQDEGEYMLERPVNTTISQALFDQIDPGDKVKLAGLQLWAQEKGEAVMVGAQGVLPIEASPDARMQYVDLTDNKHKATIEMFPDGSQHVFVGRYLGHRDLVAEPADEVGPAHYAAPALRHPGDSGDEIIRTGEGLRPASVTCPQCAGTIELRDVQGTAMVACSFCGSGLDVTVPSAIQLLYQSEKKKLPFPIPIGATGTLRGVSYTVVGRLRYWQRDEGVDYFWDALQLYNQERGYAFLELENGHWLFFQRLQHPVHFNPRFANAGTRFAFEGQRYKVFERGSCQIVYVEGELSWVARIGDQIGFLDATRPPYMISAEWSADELEWSMGHYQTPEEIAAAFNLSVEQLPQREGVAPAQPFLRSANRQVCLTAGAVSTVILLMLAVMMWLRSGTAVLAPVRIAATQYLSEEGYVSRPFELPEGGNICKLTASSASLNNQWIGMAIAILDADDNILLDAETKVEYFAGTEGGERWSEGSRSDSTLIRLEGPGPYRLNVFGDAGSWSPSGGDQAITNRRSGPNVTIAVHRGVSPARYYIIAAVLAAIFPVYEMARQVIFFSRQQSDEDDDDD